MSYDKCNYLCIRYTVNIYSISIIKKCSLSTFLVSYLSLPEMQKTLVWSLGQEGPLEKEMTTHASILAWKILWIQEPGGLQSMGLQRIGHDWAINTHTMRKQWSLSLYIDLSFLEFHVDGIVWSHSLSLASLAQYNHWTLCVTIII